MAGSNVDIVRAAFEAFDSGDVDGLMEWVHPDMEYMPLLAQLQGVTYCGPEGMRQFLEDMDAEWDVRIETSEFREVGPNRVVVLGRMHVRGQASGVELETPFGWVVDLRDGKGVRMQAFPGEEQALAAAADARAEA